MQFKDITNEQISTYALKDNEECVFFMLNKSGQVTIELAGENAKAYIFALFVDQETAHELSLTQKHLASHTISEATIHSVLGNNTSIDYRGLIHIAYEGGGSVAAQESRALLLSNTARHSAIPSLEILPRDVTCHHKASASSLNPESLYYLQSRGLNRAESSRMLINGFIQTITETMQERGIDATELQKIEKNTLQKITTLNYA